MKKDWTAAAVASEYDQRMEDMKRWFAVLPHKDFDRVMEAIEPDATVARGRLVRLPDELLEFVCCMAGMGIAEVVLRIEKQMSEE